MKTSNIYCIQGRNHFGDITFELYTIDKEYATEVYAELTKCVDVAEAEMVNAVTGELLAHTEF